MNSFGHNIKCTFFGESHGEFLGIVIEGLPPGLKINTELIDFNLSKRRPKTQISTSRVEDDQYRIVSGVENFYTTGAALTFLIPNSNIISKDYQKTEFVPRPSHADYTAYVKYQGFNTKVGGGIFSGRITALWIIIGSICQQLLENKDIYVTSHIKSMKDIYDESFSSIDKKLCKRLNKEVFPLLNQNIEQDFISYILSYSQKGDSLGGVIETAVINHGIGLGEPLFLSVESYLSYLIFSIPSVKGIEFGLGFDFARNTGSESNDSYSILNNSIKLNSNNNGGILGGITNGEPIILRTVIKPTPSISKPQKSIDLMTMKDKELKIEGRHDPQIVSRAIHVINSVVNFAMLDLLLFNHPFEWFQSCMD
jgi:chorismate synthase